MPRYKFNSTELIKIDLNASKFKHQCNHSSSFISKNIIDQSYKLENSIQQIENKRDYLYCNYNIKRCRSLDQKKSRYFSLSIHSGVNSFNVYNFYSLVCWGLHDFNIIHIHWCTRTRTHERFKFQTLEIKSKQIVLWALEQLDLDVYSSFPVVFLQRS